MRNAFAKELTALAADEPRLVALMADIGNHLFDDYRERYPKRFYNCGVAEANMISVAAGMAASGLRPVCYTITPFVTSRCLEQIRVDVCYHNVPVVIVGTGAGLSYASLGATHHSCEDIAMMRALPGLKVLCPADSMEVRACLRAALKEPGPVYMRIGKKGEPAIHAEVPDITLGKSLVIKGGRDVCLLNAGFTLPIALEAANMLEKRGVSTEVASFHTVKPLDEGYLDEAFGKFRLVVTIEEHSLIGGFGAAVAEWCSNRRAPRAPLLRFGTRDEFLHFAADQDYARDFFGLTSDNIATRVAQELAA